ncbi:MULTISPECIES: malto-oligosyltrehalose trehalohydrolase [unclassified Streptomyces]|uniref:malto-oligosyltrehalose trehalohydrolase n=1 Tax=unclassified Streptomyces TaxID=2593676 RepID=UPI0022B6A394|nr:MULTISPECIES: malto-oligosyltrehalose trehalohydrolase [unclassified Streptomyces]MCZ7415957.1 malto-oligosyltrehalose trehalohydrolase [Streptomyces sp. WMMC897]MCZ7434234.1 malto-oligosyltrehalose trehalohydrolase [Streptomyces sp. WMMC1477]
MLFEVWAPHAEQVRLRLAPGPGAAAPADRPMERDPARPGWWRTSAPAASGTRYGFVLDDGPVRPDPRSRRQPEGPEGLSAVLGAERPEPADSWPGRELNGAVLYELHVGTFTPEGTLDAAAGRLDHLARLGVTHVQLMPLSPFPGRHGWGYDGVAPWAVHEPYGGPEGLHRFVAAAHRHGLGVVLDVVHNHLGPSGNQLPAFGPYFTDRHHTPWGAAVNLDAPGSDEVRAYFIGSALAFLRDYRLDGLRLDAVHALADTRAEHFLAQLSAAVDALSAELGRPLFLIAESDRNDPRTTSPRPEGGLGLHAQWNDDFHHALHTALTAEAQGYYADFARDPVSALVKTLTGAFFHDGTYSGFRGRGHGAPVDTAAPAHRFVGYAQTHDQIGNRALGDRLSATLSPGRAACAAALVLCGPFTPMLFMGEEWGARTPWQYFTDHPDPELAEAVRTGRRREFAAHGWAADDVPDPQDPATRDRSCLDWAEPAEPEHARLLDWHRRLVAVRRAHLDPGLRLRDVTAEAGGTADGARWLTLRHSGLLVAVNLGDVPAEVPALAEGEPLAATQRATGTTLPPEAAVVLKT